MAKRVSKAAVLKDEGDLLSKGADDGDAPPPPAHPVTRLDQVMGQATAKRVLQAAMRSERIHHAWIFHGPAGVGKRTTAVAFGATLLDPTTAPNLGGELSPDPESQAQRMVSAGTHPDLHVITKELAGISRDDQVRKSKQSNIAKAVIEEFLLEPAAKSRVMHCASLGCKVFIVDEAELLEAPSQNALLKTLEEPATGTIIILVTSAEERLLPTIRSRCQRVAFTPLDEKEMTLWLSRRGGEAGLGAIDPKQRAWLLKYACGSPGAAEVAIVNNLFEWEEMLGRAMEQVEKGQFPMGLGAAMAEMIDERAAAWVKQNPDASKDAANKAWARRMLAFLAEDLRCRLRTRAGGKAAADLEKDVGAQRLLGALEAITAAEGYLGTNVNMALMLDNLVAQMCAEPLVLG